MRDPTNRRFGYAFTNCTNCGPRYTITRRLPYDRAETSMSCFPLCSACREEYENPADRRFHAQPNACPVCGPRLRLVFPGGSFASGGAPEGEEALRATAAALHAGKIAAIKGLGGFHLACDATNAEAVAALRLRKKRPHKALAVMAPTLAEARRLALLSPEEEKLLSCAERPITVCARPLGATAADVAPDDTTLGIMLPYTPLHHLLLAYFAALRPPELPAALVMTSGNTGGDPLCLGNREALARLANIADVFLLHNRDILIRTDDSVLRPLASAPQSEGVPPAPTFLVYRRARGLTPRPLHLGRDGPPVLGTGADLKSALCLTRGEWAFTGQHIGDLHNTRTLRFYHETAEHLRNLLQVRPEAVVSDLHPDYQSTRYAEESGLPVYRLQHHFAHFWSVIAEQRAEGALLGLMLDGTGYGEDGTIWGGELLFADTQTREHLRLGRLAPFVLPGGEAAIREPWRIAQALAEELGEDGEWPWLETEAQGAAALKEMLRRGVNCPRTSSCGRLFDAVAAFLGLSRRISYEGQAALRLEATQAGAQALFALEFPLRECGDLWELDTHAFLRAFLRRRVEGANTAELAAAFHISLARAFADMALGAARRTGARRICLSGGVFQNACFARLLPDLLVQRGLTPLMPREMPAHDGGIALGQVAWSRSFIK